MFILYYIILYYIVFTSHGSSGTYPICRSSAHARKTHVYSVIGHTISYTCIKSDYESFPWRPLSIAVSGMESVPLDHRGTPMDGRDGRRAAPASQLWIGNVPKDASVDQVLSELGAHWICPLMFKLRQSSGSVIRYNLHFSRYTCHINNIL